MTRNKTFWLEIRFSFCSAKYVNLSLFVILLLLAVQLILSDPADEERLCAVDANKSPFLPFVLERREIPVRSVVGGWSCSQEGRRLTKKKPLCTSPSAVSSSLAPRLTLQHLTPPESLECLTLLHNSPTATSSGCWRSTHHSTSQWNRHDWKMPCWAILMWVCCTGWPEHVGYGGGVIDSSTDSGKNVVVFWGIYWETFHFRFVQNVVWCTWKRRGRTREKVPRVKEWAVVEHIQLLLLISNREMNNKLLFVGFIHSCVFWAGL